MWTKALQGILMIKDPEERPHLWIKNITEKDTVRGHYLVKEKRLAKTRNGKPFISITLTDRTGDVGAKVWNSAEEYSALFHQGDIIEVEGNAESYRGQIQISVSELAPLKGEVDHDIFLESAPGNTAQMMKALRDVLSGVQNAHLKALTDRFFTDKEFVALFEKAPAAKNFHHAYTGGLLEHTLSVCQMSVRVAEHYPRLDRELLLTGAFLHDIGKIRELKAYLQIDYTDEGRLLGHVVMGVAMVDEKLRGLKSFPQELAARLKHLILSHHGQYDFGSPKRPKFLEAFALHMIDDLDAKINGLGHFMEKDRREGAWTDFNRLFDRYFLKGEILSIEKDPDETGRTDVKQGKLFSP
jgi:3'-5' exoribonuclease